MKVSLGLALVASMLALAPAARAQTVPSPAPSSSPSPSPLPAGVVPSAVEVRLAGTVTPGFALARIRAAIDRLTGRRPGTTLDVHGVTIGGNLAPGTTLDALAGVAIAGHGAFLDVDGRTNVHLSVAVLPPFAPAQLIYSDDPEYVAPMANGVLVRGTVALDTPVRVLLYHVASVVSRRVSLVLSAPTGAQVQVAGAAVGPNPYYAFVGQQTTARFLHAAALQESVLIDIAPGRKHEIAYGTLQPDELIEAIEDLRVVSGGPVDVAVVTSSLPGDLRDLSGEPELGGDSHGRRGVFSLAAIPPATLALTVGAPDPAPVNLGVLGEPNLRPGGRPLGGDYGIARSIQLHLTNPGALAQTAYLYERTLGGGGATVTMLFDGDDAATTIPCVNDAVTPHLIRAFDLAPGADLTIGATYMTDGASSYPVAVGLTTTPPLPVPSGACNGST